MSSRSHRPRSSSSRIRVRGVRRAEPDLRKLARALIDLAIEQSNAETQNDTTSSTDTQEDKPGHDSDGGRAA